MIELNNKPLRGRRILVTRANESQYQEHQAANQVKPNHQNRGSSSTSDGRNGPRGKGPTTDPMRPTTLSILKSQQQPKGVNNKIAALEAKLASMQKQNDQEESPSQSEEPAASSSSLLPKPAFLPSNPLLNLNSTNPINPSMKSTTKDYRLNQSSVLSHNPEKKPVEFKNSVNLEALGLTLKEQLKRNRQSQASTSNDKGRGQIFSGSKTGTQEVQNTSDRSQKTENLSECTDRSDKTDVKGLGEAVDRDEEVRNKDSKRMKCDDDSSHLGRLANQERIIGNHNSQLKDSTKHIKPDLNKISWSAKKR